MQFASAPFPSPADNSPVTKLLTILVLGILVYLIVSRMRRGADRAVPPPRTPSTRSASGAPEDMVRCAVCGVHLPRSESFTTRGQFYCSDEHRRADGKGG
jgi:uncharacterized protein